MQELAQDIFRGRIARDDTVQLVEKRQPRRGLTGVENQNDRVIGLFNAPVECLVIFDDLSPTYPFLADEDDEGRGLRYFLGQFR